MESTPSTTAPTVASFPASTAGEQHHGDGLPIIIADSYDSTLPALGTTVRTSGADSAGNSIASKNHVSGPREIKLALTGFSCSSCVSKLTSVLQPLSPNLTVSTDLPPSTAVLRVPPTVSEVAIADALSSLPSGKSAQIINCQSLEALPVIDDAVSAEIISAPAPALAPALASAPALEPTPAPQPSSQMSNSGQSEKQCPPTSVVRRFRCGCPSTTCTCSPVRVLPKDPGTFATINSTSRVLVSPAPNCRCSPSSRLGSSSCEKEGVNREIAIDIDDTRITPTPDNSQVHTVSFVISGMTCAACVSTVRQTLEAVAHVRKAHVSLLASRAELLVHAGLFDPADVIVAMEAAGFEASSLTSNISVNNDGLLHFRFSSVGEARRAIELLQDSPSVDSATLLRYSELPSAAKYRRPSFSLRSCLSLFKHRSGEEEDCLPIIRLESRAKLAHFTTLQDRGFDFAIVQSSDPLITGKLDASSLLQLEAHHSLQLFLGSLAFTLPIFIITMVLVHIPSAGGDRLTAYVGSSAFTVADIVSFVLATPVQFVFGFRFYRGTWFALKKRRANMDVLIAIGTTVAYFFGVIILAMNTIQIRRGLEVSEEGSAFQTSSLLITIVLFGKWLETIAKKKTVAGIEAISKLAPRNVTIVSPPPYSTNVHGNPVDVQLASVGSYFRVNAGAAFPLDGKVVTGETVVDESMLTGESWPVPKTVDDAVYAGSVNGHGGVVVQCTATGGDSMVERIASLVERAQMSRAPVEAFADRVMAYFVPIVLVVAILATIVWFALAQNHAIPSSWYEGEGKFLFALLFGLSVLVIACPCALGLATPTVVMVATSVAARKAGILYKDGGEALQAAQRIKSCLFDKTGTLTVGKPQVSAAHSVHITTGATMDLDESTSDKFEKRTLAAVAAVEAMSDHPLARAVVAFAEQNHITLSDLKVSEHQNHSGHGLSAVIDGEHNVYVGKAEWILERVGLLGLTEKLRKKLDDWEESGKTTVLAHVTGIGSLVFGIEDAPKKDSEAVISRLKAMGIRCGMITGDSLKTAKHVAAAVGIDESELHARAMPDDKVRVVENEMGRTGRAVAFVGDGVNDAAALTAASVGIAMGTGSNVATESAAIALVGDNIWDVVTTVDLSRKAMARIKLNYIWALGFNSVGIPLAAGALFPLLRVRIPPYAAAAAMALSSVCVVVCSLTLARYKRPVKLLVKKPMACVGWVPVIANILAISSAAILGVLTRVNVDALFGPTGLSITSRDTLLFYDLPANALGCFLLGAFNALNTRVAIHPLIKLAVSTGYAGSVTTFASWMFQVVRMLVRGDWLFSLLAIVFGIFISFCSFIVGRDFFDCISSLRSCISKQSPHREDGDRNIAPTSITEEQNDNYSWLAVMLTVCLFIIVFIPTVVGAIIHRENPRLRLQWTSGAVAPAGATARWLLSRLNGHRPGFPVGTFIANISAILLDLSISAAMLHNTTSSDASLILDALFTGFAGSLSTVSTWINESLCLERPQRYMYVFTTIITAVLIGLAVYGSAHWVASNVTR